MSIEMQVNPFRVAEELLSSKKIDMEVAHELCTVSRFLHIYVWTRQTGPEETQRAITLMTRISCTLEGFCETEAMLDNEAKGRLPEYMENNRRRIANITDNYLYDKPSAFLPEDKISELTRRVMTV